MSKKRTSAESNDDEETNDASDLFQQDAKRAKLTPLSDMTLHDLPIEVLERILVKAVVEEVKGLKLAKRVWKEKADLAIVRLGTVCSQWSSILTTNFFRNEVNRILDGTAQETIHWEVLHQSQILSIVCRVATMKDELFMLCRPEIQAYYVNVHNRNNMVTVKDVIPLPRILPVDMVACSVSNCVYLLNKESRCFSVLRIARNDQNRFNIAPWISDLSLSFNYTRLFVSVNGGLIILSQRKRPNSSVVSIYDANGSLQHAITLFPAIYGFRYIFSVIQKSNGNLVLTTVSEAIKTELKEIDTTGRIIRQYRSSAFGYCGVNVAYGRIMIAGLDNQGELLDSEFNLLDMTDPQQHRSDIKLPLGMHYNSDRNEILHLYESFDANNTKVLTICRFA